MFIYRRNTSKRVYALWATALTTLFAGSILLLTGHFIFGILCYAIFIALGYYPVYGLTIEENRIILKRSSAFGFKTVTHDISETSGFTGELFVNGGTNVGPNDKLGIFGIIYILLPFLYQSHILYVRDLQFNRLRGTYGLSESEYDQILRLGRLNKALPLTGAVALWPPNSRYNL